MKLQVVREYCGYLDEPIIRVGTDGLDLSAEVMHYWSSGCADEIYPTGLGARYTVEEYEVPDWMIAGIRRGQKDGRWSKLTAELAAARILDGHHCDHGGWVDAIRCMARSECKPGAFIISLQNWFVGHGCLTDRQSSAVLHPKFGGR